VYEEQTNTFTSSTPMWVHSSTTPYSSKTVLQAELLIDSLWFKWAQQKRTTLNLISSNGQSWWE